MLLSLRRGRRGSKSVGVYGAFPAAGRASRAVLSWLRTSFCVVAALGLTLCSTSHGSSLSGIHTRSVTPLTVGGGDTVINSHGGRPTGSRASGSGGARPPLGSASTSTSTTVATFRVLETFGGVDNRWIVSGSYQPLSLGQGVLWDSRGMVSGYRVLPGVGSITVTSDTWYGHASMILSGVSQATYAVALYANNSNPPLRPDPSGMITPGYVPDLAAYNAGSGPGWVAVDSSTGNALLLSVRSSVEGTPVVTDQYGNTIGQTLLSPLGARTTDGVVSALAPNDALFASTFTGAIASSNPPVVFGCNVPNPNVSPNSACSGGNLRVDITPVEVVRGDVVGVRTSPATGGTLESGAWSPSGTYCLNLSGLLVIA